jgi:hypothetical protein
MSAPLNEGILAEIAIILWLTPLGKHNKNNIAGCVEWLKGWATTW